MSDEPAVVDANVLVYSFYTGSEHHTESRRLLERARDSEAGLCTTSQVLAEFFSIVTSPKRVTLPRTPEDAVSAIEAILALPGVRLLPVPEEAVSHWLELVRRKPVTGGMIFDLQLVATMLANGVRRIYTYNRSDFETFAELDVLTP